MITFILPGLRKPAGIALAGTVFAAAWLVRGGPTWWLSIVVEVTVLVRAITCMYTAGRKATTARWPAPERMSARSSSPSGRGPWLGKPP